MPRFFIRSDQIRGDAVSINGSDAHHIYSVLRMREGDALTLCDFFSQEYHCEIVFCSPEEIRLTVLSQKTSENEPKTCLSLLMALPKGDKMEWIIQKSVELGIGRIIPFTSLYTVVKLDEKSAAKKTERYNRIARSAAEQCGRGTIPQVLPPVSFKTALEMFQNDDCAKLICYEAEEKRTLKEALKSFQSPRALVFAVGAEGGFDQKEIDAAAEAGFLPVSLGKRILRCETAPICVLSQILYEYEL